MEQNNMKMLGSASSSLVDYDDSEEEDNPSETIVEEFAGANGLESKQELTRSADACECPMLQNVKDEGKLEFPANPEPAVHCDAGKSETSCDGIEVRTEGLENALPGEECIDEGGDRPSFYIHRGHQSQDSSSEDSDEEPKSPIPLSSSSIDSSDSDDTEKSKQIKQPKESTTGKNRKKKCHTKGELELEDLPPIEELHITVPIDHCQIIGHVSSIVNPLVVVEAIPGTPALDLESVLFLQDGKPLGVVFDVFGQVTKPYYSIRFNNMEEITLRGIHEGQDVYCAPSTPYAIFVFLEQLRRIKGSDASWEDNNEPPSSEEEFSDDESEFSSRREKSRTGQKEINGTSSTEQGGRRFLRCRGRGRGRGRRGKKPFPGHNIPTHPLPGVVNPFICPHPQQAPSLVGPPRWCRAPPHQAMSQRNVIHPHSQELPPPMGRPQWCRAPLYPHQTRPRPSAQRFPGAPFPPPFPPPWIQHTMPPPPVIESHSNWQPNYNLFMPPPPPPPHQ